MRKERPEFGWGQWRVLDAGDSRILAHRCDWLQGTVFAVHNLSGAEVEAKLDVDDGEALEALEALTDLFGCDEFEPLDVEDVRFTVPTYGYRWMRARRSGSDLAL